MFYATFDSNATNESFIVTLYRSESVLILVFVSNTRNVLFIVKMDFSKQFYNEIV